MKSRISLLILNLILCTSIAIAQDRPPRRDDGKPPPPHREGNSEPRRGGGQENGRQQYPNLAAAG